MNYFFKKDTRQFHFSCGTEVGYNPDTHIKVWIEDPSTIDSKYIWTLDSDDKTLIKGEECHAPD